MRKILPNNQCKMMNIVWIERGILLSIIYIIIKEYDYLIKKSIIINYKKYITLLQFFFPKLKFKTFKKHKSKNFYFNIRNIIRKQDIIIDYINNYDDIINTKKITLIPWFDMNDVIILYKYNKNEKLNVNKYTNFIKNFSYYKRCNYNNTFWDIYVENYIFKKYSEINNYINIEIFINYFNNFIKSNYTNTVVEIPKIYYIERLNSQNNNSSYNNPILNTSYNNPIQNTLYNNPIQKYNNPIQNTSYINPIQNTSYNNPIQNTSYNNPIQNTNKLIFDNNNNILSKDDNNINILSKDNYYCEINQELFNKIAKSAFLNKLYNVTKNKYNFNIIEKKIETLEKQIYIYNYLNLQIHDKKIEKLINNLSIELKKLLDIKNTENLDNLLNELKNFYK